MSLNPVLSQDIHTQGLLPLIESGEAYVLSRPKTKVTLELPSRKLVGKGDVILTTHRLVFIKKMDEDFKKAFSSINVPYSHLEKPLFLQPVFGTNHLKFTVKSGEFKLFFVSGGADLFLKLFFTFYARFRNNPNLMSSNNPITELEGDYCAFVDPGDPSHVYFTQPQTSSNGQAPQPGVQAADTNQQPAQPRPSNPEQERQRQTRWYHGARAVTFMRIFR